MQHSFLKKVYTYETITKYLKFTPNHTDKLVEQCKKGNPKAQFELYKLYSKAMYNTALRILGNREEAEDLLQETFLDCFTKIESYRGESSFGSWLKSITVNKSLSRIKNLKFQHVELGEHTDEDIDDGFDDNVETIERIKRVMYLLPDGYRVVLGLYLFEGYDHKEIGGILGVSEITSRSQYLRAKQKLVQLYKESI